MSLRLLILGLSLFSQYRAELISAAGDGPFDHHWSQLTSIDPQKSLRAAWFIPVLAVRGESSSLAGSRAGDLRMRLDGVPLWNPQTGENTLFLPAAMLRGGDLIYEHASLAPTLNVYSKVSSNWHVRAVGTVPVTVEDKWTGYGETFFNLPIGQNLNFTLSGAVGKWNQRPLTHLGLPHRGTAAHSAVALAGFKPSDRMLVRAMFAHGLQQRDLFDPSWAFNSNNAPSSMNLTNLLILSYAYRSDKLDMDFTVSIHDNFSGKVSRLPGELEIFKRFNEQLADSSNAIMDYSNPFGVQGLFYSSGVYPRRESRSSNADRGYLSVSLSTDFDHQLKAHFDYTGYNLLAELSSWAEEVEIRNYLHYTPRIGEFYLGDRILLGEESPETAGRDRPWVEPGLGLIYFETDEPDSLKIEPVEFTLSFKPRLVAHYSFRGMKLDGGSELAGASPAFAPFYDNRGALPSPDSLIFIPRENPSPERSWRTWVNARQVVTEDLTAQVDIFTNMGFKMADVDINPAQDSLDTLPSAGIYLDGRSSSWGLEGWLHYDADWLTLSTGYRFASGKATSSDVYHDYLLLVSGDTVSGMQRLSTDSRHKLVFETTFRTPQEMSIWLSDFFISPRLSLASGFPDQGMDDKTPWWAWCEISAGRSISIGDFSATIEAEVLNPFNWCEPIIGELASQALPSGDDFPHRSVFGDGSYHAARDADHDGYITASEEVAAYRRAWEYYQSITPSLLPPLGVEISISAGF